jgi:hypothetical protein
MKDRFNLLKLFWRNKRPALGLVLVICVLFLQQASASALYLCNSSHSSSFGKMLCQCCRPATSSNPRSGKTKVAGVKSSHCKSKSREASQKPGVGAFKKTATTTTGVQPGNLSSIPLVCCRSGKSDAEIKDALISPPTMNVVEGPSVVIDSSRLGHPVSHLTISHQHSRLIYLFLSSFLI